jgi:hypothetical protein
MLKRVALLIQMFPGANARVDVYVLVTSPGGSLPTNANLAPGDA